MSHSRAAQDWLATVQRQLLRGESEAARQTLAQALVEYPESTELRRAKAGALQQAGRIAEAEALLHTLLADHPGDAAAAFTLARMLKDAGQMAHAAAVMRACFADPANGRDANLAINAIELLDDCNRKADATAIADGAITEAPGDARLHAYAGMLKIQLGEFEPARRHYLFALEHDERAWEWHVAIGLSAAQRYASSGHPDFERFRNGLQRGGLSEPARAELHFALGKACDDIADYAQAAQHLRTGNASARRLTAWSRKAWRRGVAPRMSAQPVANPVETSGEFTPIFVVGMPRSGTTLLAELLSRYPRVCNRGELPWIARLATDAKLAGDASRAALHHATAAYTAQARQDDDADAHWFIDKQPLNFRYLDLMLAMFPEARIIYCQRNARDTALSLWMQYFLEDVQGYSYDFADIALVMHDCGRLMTHWQRHFADSIRSVRYEELVAGPEATIAGLADWIGLPRTATHATPSAEQASSISTASLWQARQPVNTRSLGRWRNYAQAVPELLRFPEPDSR